jgi:hypothetical protein
MIIDININIQLISQLVLPIPLPANPVFPLVALTLDEVAL